MKTLAESIKTYKAQIAKGDIQVAYRGLMQYMMDLRVHFSKKYPDHYVSGSVYQGYMDFSYFAFIPDVLKQKKLKIAIILNHDPLQFEVWLVGVNKQVQAKYWKLIKTKPGSKYRMPANTKDFISIIEHTVVETPNFDELDALTAKIEKGVFAFIEDVLTYLGKE